MRSRPPQEVKLGSVVVVQRRQRNVQKSVVLVQVCCFANLSKPITFLAFSLPLSSSLLKVPNIAHSHKESVPYHLAVPSFLAVLLPQTLPKQRKYTYKNNNIKKSMHINDLKTITLPKENRPLLLALLVVPCILAALEMPIKELYR